MIASAEVHQAIGMMRRTIEIDIEIANYCSLLKGWQKSFEISPK